MTAATIADTAAAPAPATLVGVVTLAWGAATDAATLSSYNVYRGASASTLAKLINIPAPASGYVDKSAPVGLDWYAISEVGTDSIEGAQSAAVQVTVTLKAPATPNGLTATLTQAAA